MQHDNELSLLGRMARWLESQGAVVRATHFTYEDDRAIISAEIDLENTKLPFPEGADELRKLVDRAEAALKLQKPTLPSTLEVLAMGMAKAVLQLRRYSKRRREDYYFDLFHLIEKEKEK